MEPHSEWTNLAYAMPVPSASSAWQASLKREDSEITASTVSTNFEVCSAGGGAETDNDDNETEVGKADEWLAKGLVNRLEQTSSAEIISKWSKIYEVLTSDSSSTTISPFVSRRVPQISLKQYLQRISLYFQCSKACLVLGPIYIDRLHRMHPEFEINTYSIHRLLATSIVVAAKFHDDVYYSNKHYASVAGLSVTELNYLEACFVEGLRWQLQVSPEEFDQYFCAVHGNGADENPPAANSTSEGPPTSPPSSSDESGLKVRCLGFGLGVLASELRNLAKVLRS